MDNRLASVTNNLGLEALSDIELLQSFAATLTILKSRGVTRTQNNPVGDYAEGLVARCLGLELENSSTAGHDAYDRDGTLYEIKARRITPPNKSVQLSAIRRLEDKKFHYLVAVIFEVDFSIRYAGLMPHSDVAPNSKYIEHTNSHKLNFTPALLAQDGVQDLTEKLRQFQ